MGTKTAITWEEFLTAGDEEQRWEWIDGKVEFMSPVNLRHEAFIMLLAESLARFCRAHPEWISFGSNGVFTMASGKLADARCFAGSQGTVPRRPDSHQG